MGAQLNETIESTPRPRVLLVAPNGTHLAVLARRVGESGYRIATADRGEAALAQLRRAPPDLIVSELVLPGMDGLELVRAIRADPVHRDLPLIFIVGRSHSKGAVQVLNAGADDAILKPFHFEVLAAKIARQLDRAKAIKSLHETNALLDARIVRRAIELGEMRERWLASEADRARLKNLQRDPA